jgi:type IV pilus assembly protein PilY1
MPGTCAYSAGATTYVCVNTSGTPATASEFVASGNFLNWLTASKFDIEKQILTGGKYDTTNSVLVAETRGCSGRKFIKTLPAMTGLTFAIRGGTTTGVNSISSPATEYGQTYIEIYQGTYNADDCLSAVNDWANVNTTNLGSVQTDTKNCIGGTAQAKALIAANQVIHDCFWYYNGHGLSNLQPLKLACQDSWSIHSASAILFNDPDAVCGNNISHANSLFWAATDTGYNKGFLGLCYSAGGWDDNCALKENKDYCQMVGSGTTVTDPGSTASTQGTLQNAPGFVMESGLGGLTKIGILTVQVDLTTAPTGLINGPKYTKIRFGAMTFNNNGSGKECNSTGVCSITTTQACTSDANCSGLTPAGQKCIFDIPCAKTCSVTTSRLCYQASDCPAGESCDDLAKSDGGMILSSTGNLNAGYIGKGFCSTTTTKSCVVDRDCISEIPAGQHCTPNVGDHTTGLIKAIDDIKATSWTPFSEGFYNAIGYYARTNAYDAAAFPASRSDANFNALPAPNTATSYATDKNPSQFRCQKNNILLITDGMSTADQSTSSEALAALYAPQASYKIGGTTYKPGGTGYNSANLSGYDSTNKCPAYAGSRSIATLSWVAKNRSIKNLVTAAPASTATPGSASEAITTYVVYSGAPTSSKPGLCDPKTLMDNVATNGGTSLLYAANPTQLYSKIDEALSAIAAQASSGTAASILSNSEGSGATILQALFYPTKYFEIDEAIGDRTSATWIGEVHNLWYYVDPQITKSTIREDTISDNKLVLNQDYLTNFYFSPGANETVVQTQQDVNGDGNTLTTIAIAKNPDLIKSLWRAGRLLWARDVTVAANARNIKTSINGTSLTNFTTANAATLEPYLQATPSADNTEAKNIIDFVNGKEVTGYRKRTVNIKYPDPETGTVQSGVWKLGDIISSTPRLQSSVRQNSYDLASPNGYNDKSYKSFVNSNDYKNRGMAYVGANDGMLHAFKMGKLDVTASGFKKAEITDPDASTGVLGSEQWAYIPKNILPYLRYLTETNYSHLYSLDGSTVIFDASIGVVGGCTTATYYDCAKNPVVVDGSNNIVAGNNNWRSILIGGMGIGGASKISCTGDSQCVQTPRTDPVEATKGLGYSSYFALDVTNPNAPSLLWEFNATDLGYATSGPAIIRVGDKDKNGKWYAVFASGPTGPIDTIYNQFLAQSNQPLKFFIVEIATGTIKTITTDINNAFAGPIVGGPIDTERGNTIAAGFYKDDAIYIGYTQANSDPITATTTWTKGGVVRLTTGSTDNAESIDPDSATNPWWYKKVISDIGPVTTQIAKLQDSRNKKLWLFFGTGRYFYRQGATLDDFSSARYLFGIQDPCYDKGSIGNFLDKTCTDSLIFPGDLTNQDSGTETVSNKGWYITLDASGTSFGAERVVTDTVALTNGAVFFTSFKPTTDPCGFGGDSFPWGVKYDTGGQLSATQKQGKMLIQLSTGEFKQVDLGAALTDRGGRKMATGMTGKPPTDSPPVLSKSGNKPVKRILHIQER